MKVYYWSPFISKVATVSSVIRSAESLIKYSKQNISISLVDAIGEWDQYRHKINSKIQIIKLNKKNYYNYLPKGSRSVTYKAHHHLITDQEFLNKRYKIK